jgi:hypothetical protein
MTDIPIWQDARHGAMKRSAHYLFTVVGVGNVFHKAQIREAVPGREQVDRRIRELRKFGWVIRTYRDLASLAPDELLLEAAGDHIWTPGYKSTRAPGLNQAKRRAVFDRDGNRCVVCGIGAGEEYPDTPGEHARLTIGHLVPQGRQGRDDPDNWRTECARCNEPAKHLTGAPVDTNLLAAKIRELPRADRQRFLDWIKTGRRQFSNVETLWTQYRQLPAPTRKQIEETLEGLVKASPKA